MWTVHFFVTPFRTLMGLISFMTPFRRLLLLRADLLYISYLTLPAAPKFSASPEFSQDHAGHKHPSGHQGQTALALRPCVSYRRVVACALRMARVAFRDVGGRSQRASVPSSVVPWDRDAGRSSFRTPPVPGTRSLTVSPVSSTVPSRCASPSALRSPTNSH